LDGVFKDGIQDEPIFNDSNFDDKLEVYVDNESGYIKISLKDKVPNQDSKILVYCNGNCQIKESFVYDADIYSFFCGNGYDIYMPIYPKNCTKESKLIQSTLNLFQIFKNRGESDINCIGISLGGGVLSRAAHEFQKSGNCPEGFFNRIVNHNSFSRIGNTVIASSFRCLVDRCIKLDSDEVFEGLKCKEKYVSAVKGDEVIGDKGGLLHALRPDLYTMMNDDPNNTQTINQVINDVPVYFTLSPHNTKEFNHASLEALPLGW
jgi:hypothetical protein